MPSGCFAANGAWLSVQVMAHNLARWTARIGLGEHIVTTKTSDDGSSPWPSGQPATEGPRKLTPPRSARVPCCVFSRHSRASQLPQTAIGALCGD